MTSVAFVTASQWATLTTDDQLAAAELEKRGIRVQAVLWDSDSVDWQSFDAIVLRSTWDYFKRYDAFLEWLAKLESLNVPLWNPVKVVRWNSEKTYLAALAKQGVATVQTVIVERGASRNLEGLVKDHGWLKAIVKPTVSGGAYETWMTDPQVARDDQSAFESLLKKSSVMIQPFVPEVASNGEWSLIFFGKQYSHSVLKRPRPGDYRVQEHLGGSTVSQQPPQALLDEATRICQLIDGPLLYTRVDGVEVKGRFVLMELELIEPLLFLGKDTAAPARFADALEAVLLKN
ncbi:MAG: hypothetical protein ABI947_00675 [Chloroflexota bacterium]